MPHHHHPTAYSGSLWNLSLISGQSLRHNFLFQKSCSHSIGIFPSISSTGNSSHSSNSGVISFLFFITSFAIKSPKMVLPVPKKRAFKNFFRPGHSRIYKPGGDNLNKQKVQRWQRRQQCIAQQLPVHNPLRGSMSLLAIQLIVACAL